MSAAMLATVPRRDRTAREGKRKGTYVPKGTAVGLAGSAYLCHREDVADRTADDRFGLRAWGQDTEGPTGLGNTLEPAVIAPA